MDNYSKSSSLYNVKANNLVLDLSVKSINQVSDIRAKELAKLNIFTIRDLLNHFPFRYIDLSNVSSIKSACPSNLYTIVGCVYDIKLKEPKPGLKIVEITLTDNTDTLIVSIFRQPWLTKTIKKNFIIAVAGQVEFNFGFKRMTNPFIDVLDRCFEQNNSIENNSVVGFNFLDAYKNKLNKFARIIPVHKTTSKLSTAMFRKIVKSALDNCKNLQDFIPKSLIDKYKLFDYYTALYNIHFPNSIRSIALAKRTIKYFEIFLLQVFKRQKAIVLRKSLNPVQHFIDGDFLKSVSHNLGFSLSDEQSKSFAQISCMMTSNKFCNHLLFGEVGSGKTAVAALCMAISVDNKFQSMMMVPTEILAHQHYRTFKKFFKNTKVKIEVLTRSTKKNDFDKISNDFNCGKIDVLIGTHILLNKAIKPKSCSFIVIDEQHRFGVEQKNELIKKAKFTKDNKNYFADVLYMSATPIPRSLALTLYGDMSISYMRCLPCNKARRITRVLYRDNAEAAYTAAFDALEREERVFVVCPLVGVDSRTRNTLSAKDNCLIDENDIANTSYSVVAIDNEDDYMQDNVVAAKTHAQVLQNKVFCNYNVGLLHGSMSSDEKAEVINKFSNNEIQILVCTTVVELGIDVKRASVMIIEDADRFGLSQLHQLRGRVGRDGTPANVFLISNSKKNKAIKRLKTLEKVDDGIIIAEADLSERLEGDILGNKQHGPGILKLVNAQKDKAIIRCAYDDAKEVVKNDPTLSDKDNLLLSYEVSQCFKGKKNI